MRWWAPEVRRSTADWARRAPVVIVSADGPEDQVAVAGRMPSERGRRHSDAPNTSRR